MKKDKYKNSQNMTNEEKEMLAAREKEKSGNRGVCMVSQKLSFIISYDEILMERIKTYQFFFFLK